jgi:hypothetical protein
MVTKRPTKSSQNLPQDPQTLKKLTQINLTQEQKDILEKIWKKVMNGSLIDYSEIINLKSFGDEIRNANIRYNFLGIIEMLKGKDRLLTTEEKNNILKRSRFMGSGSPSPRRYPRRSARLSEAAAKAASLICPVCRNEYSVSGFGEGKHGTDHPIFGPFPSCNGNNFDTECRAPYTHHRCGKKLCHNCWSKHPLCDCGKSIEPAPDQIEQPSVSPFVFLLGIFIATQLPSGIISQIQSLSLSVFAFIILMFLFVLGRQ